MNKPTDAPAWAVALADQLEALAHKADNCIRRKDLFARALAASPLGDVMAAAERVSKNSSQNAYRSEDDDALRDAVSRASGETK